MPSRSPNIKIKRIKSVEINDVLKILKQDTLKESDGSYPDKKWILNFIKNKKCISLCLYKENKIISVLLAEKISFGSCLLWFVATKKNNQGKGYGSILLEYFEKNIRDKKIKDINWVFLNATEKSLNFYKKHKYIVSKKFVSECLKDFN